MRRKSIWNFWTRIKWEAKFTNLNWPPLTDLNQYVQNKKWLSQSVSEWVSQSVTRLPIELSTDSVWTAKKVVRDRQTHLWTYSLEQPFRCLNYTTINHISMNIKVWKWGTIVKFLKPHCIVTRSDISVLLPIWADTIQAWLEHISFKTPVASPNGWLHPSQAQVKYKKWSKKTNKARPRDLYSGTFAAIRGSMLCCHWRSRGTKFKTTMFKFRGFT